MGPEMAPRAVHGDLPQAVLQGIVAEARDQRLGIARQIHAFRHVQGRRRLATHIAVHQGRQAFIGHGLGHGAVTGQAADIGQQRMAAIEQAQLHGLEGTDVRHHLHPFMFPVRAPLRKAVLDHPLTEGLADHGGRVIAAEIAQPREGGFVHGRNDAIHHAAGKGHLGSDPGRQPGVLGLGEGYHRLAGPLAVVRHVVAAEDGEGRDAGRPAPAQAFHQQPRRGARRPRFG